MLWHVYLTRFCNLQCTYCGADALFESIPHDPQYVPEKLLSFLKQDPDPIINFYGGEPLIRIEQMIEIMDLCLEQLPAIKFVLQTNGLFLHKIPSNYVTKFHSILVSIDGRPELTDNYRGNGVFEKIRENLAYVSNTCSFTGELIARMTVSRHSDVFKEVTFLLDHNNNLGFTHVHWQLDVLWNSESWIDLPHWIRNIYNQDIRQLIEWWINQMRRYRKVYKIIPFLGIIWSLLSHTKTELRCGAGVSSYTISTDGNLIFCPIGPEEPEAITGTLDSPLNEVKQVRVGEPCTSCNVLDVCGGRCLYTNFFKPGAIEDYTEVCSAVKFLINELNKHILEIKDMLRRRIISEEQLIYPEINNGTEIIP